jgi:hypothetical protein
MSGCGTHQKHRRAQHKQILRFYRTYLEDNIRHEVGYADYKNESKIVVKGTISFYHLRYLFTRHTNVQTT